MKRMNVFAMFMAIVSMAFGQHEICGTELFIKESFQNNPNALEEQRVQDSLIRAEFGQSEASRRTGKIIVPVVVHVIWWNCEANISTSQVKSGIDFLNNSFNLQLPDTDEVREVFKPHMGDMDIEFRLAQIDPSGNPTNGISRDQNSISLNVNTSSNDVRNIYRWGSLTSPTASKYFHIWVVEQINLGVSGQINGFGMIPASNVDWSRWGLVIRHDRFGTTGTAGNDGTTLPHEVGHCFNLWHTFYPLEAGGSACSSNMSCSAGDQVCDTPPVGQIRWDCSPSANTCSFAGSGSPYSSDPPDMMENIMSYSSCRAVFTEGQVTRMTQATTTSIYKIKDLVDEDNLIATGVAGFLEADFVASNEIVVADRPMIFKDNTRYESDDWKWGFGASTFPPTSTAQEPEVTFIQTGPMPVNLTVFSGSDSLMVQKDVLVVSERGEPVPFLESFEEGQLFDDQRWYSNDTDEDGNSWMLTSDASYAGDRSLMIENFGLCGSTQDELTSSTLDLEPFSQVTLTFKAAFARRTTSNNDFIRVLMSKDYGETWDLVKVIGGSSLASVENLQNGSWTPADTSEWKEHSYNVSNTFKREGALIRFQFNGDGGNNLYLDDIKISGTYKNKVFLVSPKNRKLGLATDVTLDWKAVGEVDFYEYQIDTETSYDTPELRTGTNDYIDASPENEDTQALLEDLSVDTKYYWRVRASKGGVVTEWSDNWNFRISNTGVGVKEMMKEEFLEIFPNPAQDRVTVKANAPIQSIELLDLSGRIAKVVQRSASSQIASISVSACQPGTYFLRVTTVENDVYVKPLIIQ